MRRRPGSDGGFTLLELLVTASILAVTATALFSTFTLQGRARTRLREQVTSLSDLSMLQADLHDDLSNLARVQPMLAVGPNRIVLNRLVRESPGQRPPLLRTVRYAYEPSADGGDSVLVRRVFQIPWTRSSHTLRQAMVTIAAEVAGHGRHSRGGPRPMEVDSCPPAFYSRIRGFRVRSIEGSQDQTPQAEVRTHQEGEFAVDFSTRGGSWPVRDTDRPRSTQRIEFQAQPGGGTM